MGGRMGGSRGPTGTWQAPHFTILCQSFRAIREVAREQALAIWHWRYQPLPAVIGSVCIPQTYFRWPQISSRPLPICKDIFN